MNYEKRRILIWGKTYPELSKRYKETVCTGGCFEDGRPVRLYPVPLRYLEQARNYKLYQWITVPMKPSPGDSRPESHKIDHSRIELEHVIDSKRGWEERRQVIFADKSWHFRCLSELKAQRESMGQSIGLVKVGSVEKVAVVRRPTADRDEHEEKLRRLQSILDLFEGAQKDLQFQPFRIQIKWRCADEHCSGHGASVLDWGLGELGRREGAEAARAKMQDLADVAKYDLHFFMGNMKSRPRIFSIIGLWYPLRRAMQQHDLFRA